MARPKGVKNKTIKEITKDIPVSNEPIGGISTKTFEPIDIQQQVVEIIKEVFVTKEVEKPQLSDFELFKALKEAGFPQGGMGQMMESPLTNETVYIPLPSEIYGQFAQDPQGWDTVRDYLARAFLELKDKNAR